MGTDVTFVVYAGPRIADEALTSMVKARVPEIEFLRHGEVSAEVLGRPVHCIAVYERADDETLMQQFTSEELESTRASIPDDAPLSAVVQAAWKLMRTKDEDLVLGSSTRSAVTPSLARQLSRSVGRAFWFAHGQHSDLAGYARFDDGELSEPTKEDEFYVEFEKHGELMAAFAKSVGIKVIDCLELFDGAFPDEGGPPLLGTRGAPSISFDPLKFELRD